MGDICNVEGVSVLWGDVMTRDQGSGALPHAKRVRLGAIKNIAFHQSQSTNRHFAGLICPEIGRIITLPVKIS